LFFRQIRRLLSRSPLALLGVLIAVSLLPKVTLADVVKPALVEISVYRDGHFQVELRASIEAMLTGINARFKNTQDAPNADEYDALRKLGPEALAKAFRPFYPKLLEGVAVYIDGERMPLTVGKVNIPERGYTKIPRISTILLDGKVPDGAQTLRWHYPARFGDNAVRVRQVDQARQRYHWSEWQWIRDDSISQPFSLTEVASQRSTWDVIKDYVQAGFDHILPAGVDHILFILGLYLYSTRLRPLLWQVTMFTLAHTLTLGLSMYGLVNLPPTVVEPLIALSIAYVGIENVWRRGSANSRLFLVFGFGLLHGLGFAGMLSDFGMPTDAFATALVSFNVGVELGQLTVLGCAALALGLLLSWRNWYRDLVATPASLTIGLLALYWFWDRIEPLIA
jgi:hydrogenase/urease accessory protein HupE